MWGGGGGEGSLIYSIYAYACPIFWVQQCERRYIFSKGYEQMKIFCRFFFFFFFFFGGGGGGGGGWVTT